jgi:hypothetical protein
VKKEDPRPAKGKDDSKGSGKNVSDNPGSNIQKDSVAKIKGKVKKKD